MQYGFILSGGDIWTMPEMAAEAEAAGWDGVFIPDCISIDTPAYPPEPMYDPWIVLALMAVRTKRVRLGTMLAAAETHSANLKRTPDAPKGTP